MSESQQYWYHCGRCGALFLSEKGVDSGRLCCECGKCPEIEFETTRPASLGGEDAGKKTFSASMAEHHAQHKSRKKHGYQIQQQRVLRNVFIGWAVGILGLGGLVYYFSEEDVNDQTGVNAQKAALTGEEQEYLHQSVKLCCETFHHYLTLPAIEQKCQFVRNGPKTLAKMMDYYNMNPLEMIHPGDLELKKQGLIDLPSGRSVETVWLSKDGKVVEAIFGLEGDEWKLDWYQFIRYSEMPWSIFATAQGEGEAEFRLLVRERLASEHEHDPEMSLCLVEPKFGHPDAMGYQNNSIKVKKDSEEGRILQELFRRMQKKETIYHSTREVVDVTDMARVRVRVKRTPGKREPELKLVKVLACHWYDQDDLGVSVHLPEKQDAGK